MALRNISRLRNFLFDGAFLVLRLGLLLFWFRLIRLFGEESLETGFIRHCMREISLVPLLHQKSLLGFVSLLLSLQLELSQALLEMSFLFDCDVVAEHVVKPVELDVLHGVFNPQLIDRKAELCQIFSKLLPAGWVSEPVDLLLEVFHLF